MRVDVLDPSAFTPPYDRALCSALAAAGHDVRLVTSRFAHGDVPPAAGFAVDEAFYRRQPAHPRARLAAKLVQHVPDMLRARRTDADVAHFQWLAVQHLDRFLLPRRTPTVLTAHDVLPREPRPGQLAAQRALYDRVDAVIAHTAHGRDRLRDLGVDATVIPHGVLDWLTRVPPRRPPELPEKAGPTVLFFGLVRPYKGVDVLQQATFDADLWVVGAPRGAAVAPPRPREHQALRFVDDAEAAWCFAHADVVVLPYREIEQSGVLFTAMGFGVPVVASGVGGFREVEALVTVPPGDPAALGAAIDAVLADPAPHRAAMLEAGRTTYAWDVIARQHGELYARITGS